jgi:hypothetical protein
MLIVNKHPTFFCSTLTSLTFLRQVKAIDWSTLIDGLWSVCSIKAKKQRERKLEATGTHQMHVSKCTDTQLALCLSLSH